MVGMFSTLTCTFTYMYVYLHVHLLTWNTNFRTWINIDLLDLKIPLCVFICWQDNLYTYMYIYIYICKNMTKYWITYLYNPLNTWIEWLYPLIGYSVIPKPSSVNECPVCATMFRKRQALRQHLADIHRDSLCNVMEDNDTLDPKSKSKKRGDSLELVTCPFCKKVLASNSNLKKHLAVHKGECNLYVCLCVNI